MISFETARDGFILTVEGRRVLRHTRSSPCIELGTTEPVVRQNRASFMNRSRRAVPAGLRNFSLRFRGADRTVVDFEGRLLMTVTYEKGVLRMDFSSSDPGINLFRINLGAHPDEQIYGCGERHSRLDLKGQKVRLRVGEGGSSHGASLRGRVARRGRATDFPSPVYVSSANYWTVVDTDATTSFDFGSRLTKVECQALPGSIAMGFGCSIPKIMTAVSSELGRQPAPPDWVYNGATLGLRGGLDAVRKKLDAVVSAGASVSAICVEDWCGSRETPSGSRPLRSWRADATLYPSLPAVIAALRERGIRFLGYIEPLLDVGSVQYREASTLGYCVKNRDGADYLAASAGCEAAMVDLSHPGARRWFKEILKRELLGIGMAGWMADSGEGLPVDCVVFSGEDGQIAHNRWPELWASLNREAMDEAGASREALFFVRSGWLAAGSQTNGVWAGEQSTDFSMAGGLPSSVPASLSMGFSGIGFWHSEVGGFSSGSGAGRSPRCLARWMEMAAFTPFFRTSEGGKSGKNAQVWSDPSMLALLARFSEIFGALKPYHRTVTEEYAWAGLPPIRHPFVHYEDEAELHDFPYQYLYGRDLLVAPVLDGKSRSVSLRLPVDRWVHLWSSREFGGGDITIEAPFGYPAVFYRADSSYASLFDAIRRTVRKV